MGSNSQVKKGKIKKEERKPHYVCIGWCGMESMDPTHCVTHGCRRNRNKLTYCDCKDGKHTKLRKMYQY